MAVTDLGELTDTIDTIHEEAQFTRIFKAEMRALSWNIPKGKKTTVDVPYFGLPTSVALTDGIDMTSPETMVDTNVSLTPVEHGLKIILTDNIIEDDNTELIRAAGKLLGDAYEVELDGLGLAQLDDASTSLAGANTTLTMGHIAAGRAVLMGNAHSAGGPAPTPYACVIHPFQELDLVDVITPVTPAAGTTNIAGGLDIANQAIASYSIGRLFGMPILTDGNLAVDSSDDVKGGIFSTGRNGAMIYVNGREPTVRPERDESLRGVELNYVGRYIFGEFRAGWIVELYADAATPA